MLDHAVEARFGSNYSDVLADSVDVTVDNNDALEPKPETIVLSLDLTEILEGTTGTDLMVTARWDGRIALDEDTEVDLEILDASDIEDSDPRLAGVINREDLPLATSNDFRLRLVTLPVIILAGALFAVATLSVDIVSDIVPELDELLVVTGTADNLRVLSTALRIIDDDEAFVIIKPFEGAVFEGERFTYTVSLRPRPSKNTRS